MTEKLRDCFDEMVVYKDLKKSNFFSALGLPSFLRDWLLKKFADDEGNLDIDELTDFIHTYLPNKEEWVRIKDRIINDNERVKILTKISVDISIKTGEITFSLPDFGLTNKETIIDASTWDQYRGELVSGQEVWGVVELGYRPPDDTVKPKIQGKIRLTGFTNFCPYTIDLNYYKDVRNEFTTSEWIDVLLGAIDYNASGYESEEQKLAMLTRILPFVEKRLNLIELAPKGTGKSYVFGHVSKYGLLTDGGKVTRAKMFYDTARKTPGFVTGHDFIAIDEVKKFIAAQDLKAETRYIPEKVVPSVRGYFEEKIAIIGGGPAGLSCAFYLAEKGYKPTIFEKNERAGGMLVYGIPSFKLEKDVVQAEIDIIKEMGVEIRTGVEVGKDITLDELRAQGYKAFYIAIGCQGGRLPGIPNDTVKGCSSAVDLLKEVNANEKYDIKGDVVVIGGGNVAIDVARDSKRCGSDMVKVNMFCLESRETMPASVEEIEEAESEGIVVNPGWGPKEVLVDDNGEVRGIVLKKCISVKDADGRFNPQYDENQLLTVECKHVFFSVGQSIVWGDLLKGSKVELGRGNGAVADALTYQTAEPDIFVGGDVYTGPKFAIDAIAAGKQGAISIHRFVQPHSSLTIGRNRNDFIELNKNDIKVENYDNSSRQIPGHNDSIDTKHSFRDAKLVFTEEQVKAETARCLGCGASVVDQNKCIGCGICTTKCEFDAIKLHRELPGCSKMVPSEDKLKYILPNGAKQAIKIKFSKKK
mgnify:CR=1 FL=1